MNDCLPVPNNQTVIDANTSACAATGFEAADLIELERAVASGTLIVKYRDQEVTYRTLDEMLKIIHLMRSRLCGVGGTVVTPSGGTASRRTAVGIFSKGL